MLDSGRPISSGNVEEDRQGHAFDHFDRICDMQGVEPESLGLQDDITLEDWARAVAPAHARNCRIDVRVLRKDLPAYVAECAAASDKVMV